MHHEPAGRETPPGVGPGRRADLAADEHRTGWYPIRLVGPIHLDPVDQAIASRAAFGPAPDRLAVCRFDDELTIGVEGADAKALELLVASCVTDVVTGAPLLLAAVAERVDAHGVQPVRELKPALVLLARGAS